MKTNVIKKLALAAVVSSFVALNASAVVNYAFDPNNTDALGGAYVPAVPTTFAQVFTVANNDTINISALGVYAYELINNVTVSIYDSTIAGVTSGGALDTATFGSTSQLNGYYFKSTSLNLGSGIYAIVTSYTGGVNTSGYYTGSSGDITAWAGGDGVTLGNLYKVGNIHPQDDTAYGSGNMKFSLVPVPETGGFAVAAVALLGLVYVGRSYSRKLKVA
ncbi:MAG: hypothetical protein ABSE90_00030 [Verrucomicrobiota bacterium]